MADSKTLKLLLVEDDLDDEQLLAEALIEIEEQCRWVNWRPSSIVQVETLADALDCLGREHFDAVLLNLSLPDSPALLDTFAEVNANAGGSPIVVLADEEDESLAHRLLRNGAQDVLIKRELDCAPLARSLRYAIERQRRTERPFVDDLTGALSPHGLSLFAGSYEKLARQTNTPLVTAWLEIPNAENRDDHDLLLIRAAEILRAAFEPPALLSRIGKQRFGLVVTGFTATAIETLLHVAAREIEAESEGGQVHFEVAGAFEEVVASALC